MVPKTLSTTGNREMKIKGQAHLPINLPEVHLLNLKPERTSLLTFNLKKILLLAEN